jgi:signal transduction histidine kinase
MQRLYLRIYLAVLASLAVLAIGSAVLWRAFGEPSPARTAFDVAGTLAHNALPEPGAPAAEQQRSLERLAAGVLTDVALYAADGSRLAAVGNAPAAPGEGLERSRWLRDWGRPPIAAVRLPDGRWLVARLPHDRRHGGPFLFMLALLGLAIGIGAYPVVRRLTVRLERLQAGVESLGAGDLGVRVKVEGRDEVARLAESFNQAAARIETLVSAHKSMLANASHELRTPLARIRMAVELQKTATDPAGRREIEHDIAELDALIDEILLASRLDAAPADDVREPVELLALAAEESARYEDTKLEGEVVVVRGDDRLLRRLLRNLLENARRYGAPPIEVHVRRAGAAVELRVCDRGTGVPDAERETIFQPFHRAGRGGERGAGLGLALVRQIARRHRGDARCIARDDGGACFVVTLPVADASNARAPARSQEAAEN